MWWVWGAAALLLVAGYLWWLSSRVRRLHDRAEAAAAALDGKLARRAAASAVLAEQLSEACPQVAAGLHAVARAALNASRNEREAAENDLTRALRELPSLAPEHVLRASEWPDVVTASRRVALARQVHTDVALDAPREGRPSSRINWLLRQLKGVPDDLRIEVRFAGVRETTSELLRDAREYPQRLLSASDSKREPRVFTVTLTRPLGLKRGKGRGSFVHDTRVQAFDFYREVVQTLRAWQPKAPKLRDADAEVEVPRVEEGAIVPTPMS